MNELGALVGRLNRRAEDFVGGAARLQVIFILAAILALDTADKATLSALTGRLEDVFKIGNTDIGLLISVVSFAGAIFTIPLGILVDRMRRRRILLWAIGLWSIAMAVSGLASSFLFLLITRVFLGAITASAWPCVASLSGDFFPPRERARTYGLILAGELVGTGAGFFVSGELSSVFSWRIPFFVMAGAGLSLLWAVWRLLPEPARGGQDWIDWGQETVETGAEGEGRRDEGSEACAEAGGAAGMQQEMLAAGIAPREELILDEDPSGRSLWWTLRYVLRIPTYVLLVIASSLGYFFFAGIRAFATPYLTAHYGVSRAGLSGLMIVVGIGAICGVVLGGRLAEWLLGRGWISARIIVPGIALALAVAFLAPAIWTTSAVLGIGLLTVGAAMLGAANPPIDAARLDIMHPRLWGRAESGRMVLRAGLEGAAPVLFGFVSDELGGGQRGLMWTALIMLVPLLFASGVTLPARRTYQRDVATAGASAERTVRRDG